MYSKFSPSLLIVFQGPGERGPVRPSIPIYRARAADDPGSPKGITIDQKAQSPKPKAKKKPACEQPVARVHLIQGSGACQLLFAIDPTSTISQSPGSHQSMGMMPCMGAKILQN